MTNPLEDNGKLHKEHRRRMKERILTQGLFGLQEHEVLEYLLYYAVQQRDTSPLAHRILAHCGGFAGVFRTSYEDLLTIPGVTPHIALFLNTLPDVLAYGRAKEELQQRPVLNSVADCKRFVSSQLPLGAREQVCAVVLDNRKRVIAVRSDWYGNFNEVTIDTREITAFCLQKQAVYLLLAHTHPSGVSGPSGDDIRVTTLLRRTLAGIQVELLDHIILTDTALYSFAESNLLGENR